MRKSRSIRNRRAREKREAIDLDITSLLDILVILLVFLLKNYSSTGQVFHIQKGIKLPVSKSKTTSSAGIVVQVSPDSILVDDQIVVNAETQESDTYDQNGKRIVPLFDALSLARENVMQLKAEVPETNGFSGTINFVIDKTIGYNYLRKLFYTASEAGYFKFNLVVLNEE